MELIWCHSTWQCPGYHFEYDWELCHSRWSQAIKCGLNDLWLTIFVQSQLMLDSTVLTPLLLILPYGFSCCLYLSTVPCCLMSSCCCCSWFRALALASITVAVFVRTSSCFMWYVSLQCGWRVVTYYSATTIPGPNYFRDIRRGGPTLAQPYQCGVFRSFYVFEPTHA